MIAQETFDRVREVDIVDYLLSLGIPLKQRGSDWSACCPFHKEKTPSFHVNSSKGLFYCFGCHVGGDLATFVKLYEGLDYLDAIRAIADRCGIPVVEENTPRSPKDTDEISKRDLVDANKNAMVKFQRALESPAGADARAYLASRSFSPEACARWNIGYAPDEWSFLSANLPKSSRDFKILEAAGLLSTNEKGNAYDRFRDRVMFPVRNEQGDVVAFSGRVLHPNERSGGKYVNSPETPVFQKRKILFAFDRARRPIADSASAILVEGQIDCIRCHEAGFQNVVASQGTSFTPEHAKLLARRAREVTVVLDGDNAGRHAAAEASAILLDADLTVKIAALPPEHDPDSLILASGPEAFRAVLDAAVSPVAFILAGYPDLSSDAALVAAERDVISLVLHASRDLLAERMLREAADLLHISYSALHADFQKARAAANRAPRAPDAPSEPTAGTAATPAASALPPEASIPPAEFRLAELLCAYQSDHDLTALVRENLAYPLLTHDGIRPIVIALAEEEPDVLAALASEPPAILTLYARIASSPLDLTHRDHPDAHLRAAQDLLSAIWKDALSRLQASTPPTSPAFTPLIRDIRTLSSATSPWSFRQAVISRRLQDF